MFMTDPLLFVISLLDTGCVLILLIYLAITLSDLECDYLNAQECCSRLNQWVKPKLIAHVFLISLLLLHGYWVLAVLNVPKACWMTYEIVSVPHGNLGIYDPLEIHNRGQLKVHMRQCVISFFYYLVFFFIYLYCFIISLLDSHPVLMQDENEIISEF